MHVTSPFTAPELPLVNITTAICPSFPHSEWEFQKTWSLGGARGRKRKKKEDTKRATEAHESQKFRLRRRRERRACARRSNWTLVMYFQYFQKVLYIERRVLYRQILHSHSSACRMQYLRCAAFNTVRCVGIAVNIYTHPQPRKDRTALVCCLLFGFTYVYFCLCVF